MTKSSIATFVVAALVSLLTGTPAAALRPIALQRPEDPFAFFKKSAGRWSGHPTATAIGPVLRPVNVTIAKPNATKWGAPVDEGTWIVKHWMLDFFEVTGNWQFFWVRNDVTTHSNGSKTSDYGNMTFCFLIPSWVNAPVQGRFYFTRSALTQDSITWLFNSTASIGSTAGAWTGEWTMRLHDNNTKIHSKITFAGAAHLDVWLHRSNHSGGGDDDEAEDPEVPAVVAGKKTTVGRGLPPLPPGVRHPGKLPAICGGAIATAEQDKYALLLAGASKAQLSKPVVCPLGYTSGKMPKFVSDRIDAKKKKEEESARLENIATQRREREANGGYDNCYIMQDAMDLRVRWNWNTTTQSVDVYYTATLSTSGGYVAIGLYPEWPYMKQMDVILGFVDATSGKGCVQNLYAKASFGQPWANPTQVLNETSAWLSNSGRTLNVKFSRPWNTGHHNLDTYHKNRPTLGYELGFARGPVYAFGKDGEAAGGSDVCSNTPGYHGTNDRGVMAIGWKHPEGMPEFKKCSKFPQPLRK